MGLIFQLRCLTGLNPNKVSKGPHSETRRLNMSWQGLRVPNLNN
jgi:hypothetical protein